MSDHELLDKAARAAGYRLCYSGCCQYVDGIDGPWNPLDDDGDAFRLMVGMSLEVSVDQVFGVVEAGREGGSLTEHYDGGSYEATARRAITRAAATLADEEK